MADTTTRYGFPYQEAADPPDGASLGQDLAEAVDTALGDVEDDLDAAEARLLLAEGASNLKPLCIVRATAAQTIANATDTAITFAGEDVDTHGFHSTSSNTSRITPNKAGYYRFTGTVFMAGSTTLTLLAAWIKKNGTTDQGARIRAKPAATSATTSVQITTTVSANGTTDYFELMTAQTSGGNHDTFVGGSFVSLLECEYLRPL